MDGSRYALVVANDHYADPGLRRLVAAAADADALTEVLADPSIGGFDVRVVRNKSAQSIRLAVEDFFADRAPQDLLLLHFSGHGLKNAAGELFLAVEDTRPTRLASTAVAADFVNRQMADSRAQRIALFLDCCYGGAFPRGMVVRAAGEAKVGDAFARQKNIGGGRGRAVVTASSAMEYAFEGGQLATGARSSPSIFTSAVVEGLTTGEADRDGDGWVGLTELVSYVTDRVHRVTPNQNPQMWTFGLQGELLIARSRVRRITPSPLPPELLEAMDSPLTATRFGVVDELCDRLHGADLSQAYAAYQALQRMVNDDSRKVCEAAMRWVASAAPQVSPEALQLGSVVLGAVARGEFRLDGPPLALTATATASAPWIRVEQTGAAVQITAQPTKAGPAEGAVVVAGPTGERTVPVWLQAVAPKEAGLIVSTPGPEPVPAAQREPKPVAKRKSLLRGHQLPIGRIRWRWLLAAGLAVVVTLVVSSLTIRARIAGNASADRAAFEVPAGSCLDWTADDGADAHLVDCAQPHLFESLGELSLDVAFDPAAFPSETAWLTMVKDKCTPLASDFLHGKYDPFGRFTVGALKPSQPGRRNGDRTVRCGLQVIARSGELYRVTGRAQDQDQADVHAPGTCLGINGVDVGDPVDCAQPHAVEVVGVFDLAAAFPGPDYPDENKQDGAAEPACTKLAADYAGGPNVVDQKSQKRLTVYWDTLRAESWAAGTRKVDCKLGALLSDKSGFAPVTGSVRGTVSIGDKPAPPSPTTAVPGAPAKNQPSGAPGSPGG
jgi:Septum formation/Caspase domain